MQQAWQRVKANKGAPGIDDMSITDYPEFARTNWPRIKTSLLDGTYDPTPVKRVEIPKDNGGTRLLGIPTVSDRVIQQAITQVLVPIFDPHFSESSYGYRPSQWGHFSILDSLASMRCNCAMALRSSPIRFLKRRRSWLTAV